MDKILRVNQVALQYFVFLIYTPNFLIEFVYLLIRFVTLLIMFVYLIIESVDFLSQDNRLKE